MKTTQEESARSVCVWKSATQNDEWNFAKKKRFFSVRDWKLWKVENIVSCCDENARRKAWKENLLCIYNNNWKENSTRSSLCSPTAWSARIFMVFRLDTRTLFFSLISTTRRAARQAETRRRWKFHTRALINRQNYPRQTIHEMIRLMFMSLSFLSGEFDL